MVLDLRFDMKSINFRLHEGLISVSRQQIEIGWLRAINQTTDDETWVEISERKVYAQRNVSERIIEENILVVALFLVTSSLLGLPDGVRMRSCASSFSRNYSSNSFNDGGDQCCLATCVTHASFMLWDNFAIARLRTDRLSSSE